MKYFDGNLDHLAPTQGSAGPTVDWLTSLSSAFDRQSETESSFGFQRDLYNSYQENAKRLQELTGQEPTIQIYPLEDILGAGLRKNYNIDLLGGNPPPSELAKHQAEFDLREKQVEELRNRYPELRSFTELLTAVVMKRKDVIAQSENISQRGGPGSSIAEFLGGLAGSFTFNDPVNLATLGLGGGGRTLVTKLATEAGVNMGIEGLNQFGFVQPLHRALGEEAVNPWVSVGLAGVGAAVFRGGIEVAPSAVRAGQQGFRALEAHISPNRARARVIAEGLGGEMDPSTFNHALLRNLEVMPQTPAVRATTAAVEMDEAFAEANPYGDTHAGQTRFMQELEQVHAELTGQPQTAAIFNENLSFPSEDSFSRSLLKQEEPVLFGRLTETEGRMTATESRVAELEQGLDRGVADAVGLIDEPSAERIRAIEAELAKPGANRADLEREMDMIVDSIGANVIAKAENDFRIGPKKQLAQARKASQNARKEFNRVQREADGKIAAFQKRTDEERAVRERMPRDAILRNLQREAPLNVEVRELAEVVAKADEQVAEIGESIVQRNVPQEVKEGESPPPKIEGTDVGTEVNIPDDFKIEIDGRTVTAKALMSDLADDNAMLEAMRICAV